MGGVAGSEGSMPRLADALQRSTGQRWMEVHCTLHVQPGRQVQSRSPCAPFVLRPDKLPAVRLFSRYTVRTEGSTTNTEGAAE